MEKKKLLILSYSHLSSDPRVSRQVTALKNDFDLITCGYSPVNDENFHPIYQTPAFSLLRKMKRFFQFFFRQYDTYYWDQGKTSVKEKFAGQIDLVVANDIHTLPLALQIAGAHGKVLFDAHEYHPEEFQDQRSWRIFHKPYVQYLCKKYIPKADAFTTVANGLAIKYRDFIGVNPQVITNATEFKNLLPNPVSTPIKLVHHGASIPSRKIELMINMMEHVDERFTLDLILTNPDGSYVNELKQIAVKNNRIRVLPPVKYEEICSFTNQYDLGIFLLPPTNFNYLNALPNKLFEFMQARLGIIVSPNPEMAHMVRTYNLGKVSPDYTPQSMAKLLNALSEEEIMQYKNSAHQTAKTLNAEQNFEQLRNICKKLTN